MGSVPKKSGPLLDRKNVSLCEQVVNILKQDILTQRFQPGDALPSEEELSTRLGVSRPLFREALTILKAQGFLEARRGTRGGTFVKDVLRSQELGTMLNDLVLAGRMSVEDLGSTRLLVEPEAARLAARNASSSDLQKLSDLVAAALETSDVLKRLNLQTEFHITVAFLSGNPFYGYLIRNLMKFTEMFLSVYYEGDPKGENLHDPYVHGEVLQGLVNRSPEEAYERMYVHVSQIKNAMIREEKHFREGHGAPSPLAGASGSASRP